jgi:osmotically inducible protein OsmC
MAESRASAVWEGNLVDGSGQVSAASGLFADAPLTWAARTSRPDPKTSPEELIAAAHAACYAMAFSHALAEAGSPPERVSVSAVCHFTPVEGGGFAVSLMELDVHGSVPGLDQQAFARLADEGDQGCPVSNALRGNVEISITATLDS